MTFFYLRTVLFYLMEHMYVFFRLKSRLGNKRTFWLFFPWFVFMACYPVLFQLLPPEGQALEWLTPVVRVWLPLVYVCFIVLLLLDLGRLALWGLQRLRPSFDLSAHTRRTCAYVLIAVMAMIYGYGLYEARTLGVTYLTLRTEKLPAGAKAVRIAFISDLHIGPHTGKDMLRNTVRTVLSEKPDIILLGGDILDDSLQGRPGPMSALANLHAPYGVFSVLGNHDGYGPVQRAMDFLKGAGITLLSNEIKEAGPLSIIGIDDPHVSAQKGELMYDPMPLLAAADRSRFTILLEHRPVMREEAAGLMDLQLNGHTHGGQTIFLKVLMRLTGTHPEGIKPLKGKEGQSVAYVTRGVGFSKLPIRVLTPPEVVIIDLERNPEGAPPSQNN